MTELVSFSCLKDTVRLMPAMISRPTNKFHSQWPGYLIPRCIMSMLQCIYMYMYFTGSTGTGGLHARWIRAVRALLTHLSRAWPALRALR
jgi:hypothetical protein